MYWYSNKEKDCKFEVADHVIISKDNKLSSKKVETGVHISNLPVKSDLGCLKAQVDKKDEDKLRTVPAVLSKLSNVVDKDAVKKTVYEIVNCKFKTIVYHNSL